MSTLPALSLDSDWVCEYFQMDSGSRDAADEIVVPSLVEWVFDKRRVENWAAWLRHGFDLDATDFCVSYMLVIDSAPEDMRIYINGEKVGVYQPPEPGAPPFEIDLTYYVALEYNEIAFRVEWNAAGRFEGVRLQPVPCD